LVYLVGRGRVKIRCQDSKQALAWNQLSQNGLHTLVYRIPPYITQYLTWNSRKTDNVIVNNEQVHRLDFSFKKMIITESRIKALFVIVKQDIGLLLVYLLFIS
jgi:hypothetical protein